MQDAHARQQETDREIRRQALRALAAKQPRDVFGQFEQLKNKKHAMGPWKESK